MSEMLGAFGEIRAQQQQEIGQMFQLLLQGLA